jgi:hypothetical protein
MQFIKRPHAWLSCCHVAVFIVKVASGAGWRMAQSVYQSACWISKVQRLILGVGKLQKSALSLGNIKPPIHRIQNDLSLGKQRTAYQVACHHCTLIPHFSRPRTSRFRKFAGSPHRKIKVTRTLTLRGESNWSTARKGLQAISLDFQGVEGKTELSSTQSFAYERKKLWKYWKHSVGEAVNYLRIFSFRKVSWSLIPAQSEVKVYV